jgi:hypothetical protein
VPQGVFEHPLLHCDLRRKIDVLQGTAAANSEVRAPRLDAARSGLQYRADGPDFEFGLPAVNRCGDLFPGQGAFDEDRFPVEVRDSAAFLVERFDEQWSGWNVGNLHGEVKSRFEGS